MNNKLLELAMEANQGCGQFYESDWKYNCAAWTGEELEEFADAIVNECVMILLNEAAAEETSRKKASSQKLFALAEQISLIFKNEQ